MADNNGRRNRRRRVERYFECVCKKLCRTEKALLEHRLAPNASRRCRPSEHAASFLPAAMLVNNEGYDSSSASSSDAVVQPDDSDVDVSRDAVDGASDHSESSSFKQDASTRRAAGRARKRLPKAPGREARVQINKLFRSRPNKSVCTAE